MSDVTWQQPCQPPSPILSFGCRCPQILSCMFHLLKSSKVLSTVVSKINWTGLSNFLKTQDDFSLCHCYSHQKLHKTLIFSVSNHKQCHFYLLQEKLKRMIKVLNYSFSLQEACDLTIQKAGMGSEEHRCLMLWVWVSRATADYDGVTLMYVHKGQKLKFFHYIFCFKRGRRVRHNWATVTFTITTYHFKEEV